MFNRFNRLYNGQLYNAASAAASSVDTGSTRSPFGHIIVSVPGGDLVLIYQQGTNGLVYRRSTNGGSVWGSEIVIDTRTDVYASAIINRSTLDIHVVYSKHGDPTENDEGVYYRPLIWDSGDDEWDVGGEQTLAGGGSLYDPATAGRRNASISVGDDDFPVISYLRNEGGTVSWAVLISREASALTDFDIDLDIGVVADEDSRGAMQQTTGRVLYFVSRTGSSYSLATATITNPMAAIGLDMAVLFSWFGAESEMIAVARNDDGDRLGIVYRAGDGSPHFRLYNLTTNALVSDTAMDTNSSDSVSVTWDGALFWTAWVYDDIVRISNSGAPATVVQTFANPGSDEDWSWLNSPVSCVDSPAVVFTWSQTNSAIYVGSFMFDRTATEAETGAGVDIAQIEVSADETGSGADIATAPEVITGVDSGTGVDTATAGPWTTDSGAGTDTAGKSVTEAEAGVGSEVAQIEASQAEAGSGSEAVLLEVLIAAADSGSGTDAIASLGISTVDSGSGAITGILGFTQAETGVGVDIAQIEVSADESGAGVDTQGTGPTVTDTGTGVDAVLDVDKQGNAETGVGVDAAVIRVSAAEEGSGNDVATDGIAIILTDSGAGVDVATQTWIPTAIILRLLMSSGEIRLKVES